MPDYRKSESWICWPTIAAVVVAGVGALGLYLPEAGTPKPSDTSHTAAEQIDRANPAHTAVVPVEPPFSQPPRGTVAPEPPVRPVQLLRKSGRAEKPREPASQEEVRLDWSLVKSSREVDLQATDGAAWELVQAWREHAALAGRSKQGREKSPSEPMERLLAARADLAGLPLLAGKACRRDEDELDVLGEMSGRLRTARRASREKAAWFAGFLREESARAAGAMGSRLFVELAEQTCQAEGPEARLETLATLAKIEGDEAARTIARRAVFDGSRVIRNRAISLLQDRDGDPAREVLLAALRHPWPPAADHAALALVALRDEGAIPKLREMLAAADPNAASQKDGKWRKKELVRVNHMRNCLLCHPPSFDESDPMSAPVPTPGQPLPAVYYELKRRSDDHWVRADVVYFRQDFSVMHAVPSDDGWPGWQRFDYFVAERELSVEEAALEAEKARGRKSYPQREAIRWALAQLEGLTLRW